MTDHERERAMSEQVRQAVEANGLAYRHIAMRPWMEARPVEPNSMLTFHCEEFEPDDREAYRNAGEYLLRNYATQLDGRGGILARLPTPIRSQFMVQAASYGFRRIDSRQVEGDDCWWDVFKRPTA